MYTFQGSLSCSDCDEVFTMCPNSTWHDEKGSLGLHGYQAHAQNAGSIWGWDATHPTHFLQSATQGLEVSPAQQNAPIWKSGRDEQQYDTGKCIIHICLQTQESTIPFNSPCPILPRRPITTLHGTDVICTKPKHQSHSFCRPSLRTEPFFLRALQVSDRCTCVLTIGL